MRVVPVLLLTLAACRSLPPAAASPLAASVERPAAPAIETQPEAPRNAPTDSEAAPKVLADAIHPCDPDGSEAHAATAALDRIGLRIDKLGDAANPKPLTAELETLLGTACFQIGVMDPRPKLAFDSGLALRTWWDDGGSAWARHYLELEPTRTVVLPPSVRRSLLADANASHPLAPLLCRGDAAGCGQETTGWRRRAEQTFVRDAKGASHKTEEECTKEALEATPELRFGIFRECLESVAPKRAAMPLGRFKAPADGWLVVAHSVAFAHRGACDELAAVDLATGAAFRAGQCNDGTVTRRAGRVTLAEIREAAWMLALAPTVDREVRTSSESYEVGEEIPIQRPLGGGRSASFRCGFSIGTRESTQWSWMRGSNGTLQGRVSGVLRGSRGSTEAEAHALELLAIALDGFQEGCSPNGPPARVDWSAPGDSVAAGHAASFDAFDRARGALQTTRPTAICSRNP